MNGEEALAAVRRTIEQKTAETPSVQRLIDRINSGQATCQDTALYARWAAVNLGLCLSDVICQIDADDRSAVCKALLLDQYGDINKFVDMVQAELDSRFGIQLAPQRAPFNAERAETIGHSLADRTVPDETIRRRAKSATETMVKSMHDDRMKAEAKFRSRLGLDVTIERKGSDCCAWCAEVAGRYPMGEEPEGIFRRHDNCDCTVIYGSQVLRGAVNEKGRRTKTWEEVDPKKVPGTEPTRLTREQAAEIEAKHQPTVLTGGKKPAIIKNIELPPETSEIRSMSDKTKKAISDAFDRIMAAYDVRVDELITTALDQKYSKVPFQFQPIKGENGELIIRIVINSGYDFMGSQEKLQARIMRNHDSGMLSSTNIDGLIAHELAHAMTFQDIKTFNGYLAANKALTERCVEGISIYADAMGDGAECIAEAFAANICGQPISQEAQALLDEFVERRRKHEK